jgi:hypothetical protein
MRIWLLGLWIDSYYNCRWDDFLFSILLGSKEYAAKRSDVRLRLELSVWTLTLLEVRIYQMPH